MPQHGQSLAEKMILDWGPVLGGQIWKYWQESRIRIPELETLSSEAHANADSGIRSVDTRKDLVHPIIVEDSECHCLQQKL